MNLSRNDKSPNVFSRFEWSLHTRNDRVPSFNELSTRHSHVAPWPVSMYHPLVSPTGDPEASRPGFRVSQVDRRNSHRPEKKQPMCNLPPIWGYRVYVNYVSMSVYVNYVNLRISIIHVLKFSFRHVENGWKWCIASPVRWECHPKTATVCMTNCS